MPFTASDYPSDHKVGMRVPKGGSNCAKCEYVKGQFCQNKYFNKLVGKRIPAPTDCYCCDFFEPAEERKVDHLYGG